MSGIRDRHRVPRAYRRTLRFSLALPVLIAALALTALWAYAGSGLVKDGLRLRDDADLAESVASPAHDLLTLLQDERRLTAAWQADPTDEARAALDDARSDTDVAAETLRRSRAGFDSDRASVREHSASLIDALDELSEQREAVDDHAVTAVETFRAYTDAATESLGLFGAAIRLEDGERLARDSAAAVSLVEIGEMVSRQRALVAGVSPGGDVDAAVREEFTRALALQLQARTMVAPEDLPEPEAEGYERLIGSPHFAQLVTPEDPDGTGTAELPDPPTDWQAAAETVGEELRRLSTDAIDGVADEGSSQSGRLLLTAVLGTLAALAALAGAIVLARRLTRSLIGRVSRLRRTTEELTDSALPQLAERLGREQQSDAAASPGLEGDYGADEIGRLAAAMRHQWQEVVETINRQARGREGSETVFLGLARRTQVLINRMIPMLDKLERQHQDSRLLKDIFAVDHLATRVRRHTENLLILGGALPARRWGKPVPIYEVMRSAISETEDYSRVEALPAPPVSLTGRAVADVVHLLAELIENGTSFSPPETKVTVSAEVVARGRVALEVVDRGLGMSEDEYDRVNRLLADPPKLDVMTLGEAPRLGLFVVARLAKRHGLEIALRKSPYGGTLAVVLLPSELLEESRSLLSSILPDAAASDPDADSSAADAAATAATAAFAPPAAVEPEERDARETRAGDGAGEPREDEAPVPAAEAALAAVPASDGLDVAPPSLFDYDHDDHSGYPAYGGAGLLPSTPGGRGLPAEDAAFTEGRAHPPVDRPADTANAAAPAGDDDVTPQPSVRTKSSLRLPVRVRGESLAEQLRLEQQAASTGQGDEEQGTVPSPDRAGAIMAAIQSGNRRARNANPATPAGDHDSEATTPGHDADAEGPARKDQR
ncbi:sensor histidine kinase [Streptomyces sp. 6N223]|uniref:sensor histidine kinase n=1 Tax=Streptomyces sp. 6N223 TaxID=3457412 RepID=UPI003FD4D4C3